MIFLKRAGRVQDLIPAFFLVSLICRRGFLRRLDKRRALKLPVAADKPDRCVGQGRRGTGVKGTGEAHKPLRLPTSCTAGQSPTASLLQPAGLASAAIPPLIEVVCRKFLRRPSRAASAGLFDPWHPQRTEETMIVALGLRRTALHSVRFPGARRWCSTAGKPTGSLDSASNGAECLLQISPETGVAQVVLNRPAFKNALGRVLLYELQQAVQDIRNNDRVRCVVLSSSVPGVFCAGADLKERATMSPQEVGRFVQLLRSTFTDIENLPIPTIACVEGAALGGGLELALSCDLRIASQGSVVGLPETSLAIIPGAGGTQRLPRLIGASRAKELIFTAKRLSGNEAFLWGIANHVADDVAGATVAKAMEIANKIAENGPVAVRAAKAAIDQGMQVDRSTGLSIEDLCYSRVIPTQDRLEGLQAFREKRKPVYRGE